MSGLAGHMMNPQEDLSLGYKDIVDMISYTPIMKLYEKLDGINVFILKHNGEIRIARSKKDLEVGGIGINEIDDRFKNSRAKKYFKFAIENVTRDLKEFEGRYVYNSEIIYGKTNVMRYRGRKVFIHELVDLETGVKTRTEHSIAHIRMKDTKGLREIIEPIKDIDNFGEYYFNRFIETTGCVDKDVFDRLMSNKKLLKSQSQYKHIEENWKQIRYEIISLVDNTMILLGEEIKNRIALDDLLSDGVMYKIPEMDDIDYYRMNGLNDTVTEGLVFHFNGKEYKWTGVFGPLNQLVSKYNLEEVECY